MRDVGVRPIPVYDPLPEGLVGATPVFVGPSAVFTNVRTPCASFPRNCPEDFLPTVVKRGATKATCGTFGRRYRQATPERVERVG
jgi:hypothetical protein